MPVKPAEPKIDRPTFRSGPDKPVPSERSFLACLPWGNYAQDRRFRRIHKSWQNEQYS